MLAKHAAAGLVLAIAVASATVGCTHTPESAAPTPAPSSEQPSSSNAPAPSKRPTPSPKPVKVPGTFDPKNFSASGYDVNTWLPMAPGVQSVSKGFVTIGSRRLPHIKVVTITDVSKRVDGVRTILVLDQDFDGGQLSEQAVDYLAEDVGGNVWYLGSYTEAYEGGQFLNAQDAWLAGVNGAAAGLFFPGDPAPGNPPFYQVQVPGGEQSSAQVVQVGAKTCVPFNCFNNVVVVEEGGAEHKSWAPGVGGILTEPLSGSAQETEELINIRELSAKALAELSREALRLDANAGRTVPSVFGSSAPAARQHP